MFVPGDDAAAKPKRSVLCSKTLHLATIDLGDLRTGGALQQAGEPLSGANLIMLA